MESSAAFVISEVKKSEDQGEKTTFWGEGIDVGEGDKEGCSVQSELAGVLQCFTR